MLTRTLIAIIAFIVVSQVFAADVIEFKTDKEKLSYSLGYQAGSIFLKNPHVEYDVEHFVQGVRAGISDQEPALSKRVMQDEIKKLQGRVIKKLEKEKEQLSKKNLKQGKKFLKKNKKKKGVVTLKSGLQYKVLKIGKGQKPKMSNTVIVNYIGKDIEDKEFTNTYPSKPSVIKMTAVLKGWQEALQLMSKGSKWRLFVPAELAYGVRGAMPRIEPNAVLIFDVELLDIK